MVYTSYAHDIRLELLTDQHSLQERIYRRCARRCSTATICPVSGSTRGRSRRRWASAGSPSARRSVVSSRTGSSTSGRTTASTSPRSRPKRSRTSIGSAARSRRPRPSLAVERMSEDEIAELGRVFVERNRDRAAWPKLRPREPVSAVQADRFHHVIHVGRPQPRACSTLLEQIYAQVTHFRNLTLRAAGSCVRVAPRATPRSSSDPATRRGGGRAGCARTSTARGWRWSAPARRRRRHATDAGGATSARAPPRRPRPRHDRSDGGVREVSLTAETSRFIVETRIEDVPAEVLRLAKRSILDGLGLARRRIAQHRCRDRASRDRELRRARERRVRAGHGSSPPGPLRGLPERPRDPRRRLRRHPARHRCPTASTAC